MASSSGIYIIGSIYIYRYLHSLQEVIYILILQVINFYFVPPPLRVLYVNGVLLLWVIFLSYFKHRVDD